MEQITSLVIFDPSVSTCSEINQFLYGNSLLERITKKIKKHLTDYDYGTHKIDFTDGIVPNKTKSDGDDIPNSSVCAVM